MQDLQKGSLMASRWVTDGNKISGDSSNGLEIIQKTHATSLNRPLPPSLDTPSVISNKKPETIIQDVFKIWISVYGSADKFLSGFGGEFTNKDFMDMCEILGITVKTTAAKSPWSNNLVEKHNVVLSEMLDKVIDVIDCDINLAVSWCVNAKNSLHNLSDFAPYQLILGTNPKLPFTLTEKLMAFTKNP